jgi:hypothetical protein
MAKQAVAVEIPRLALVPDSLGQSPGSLTGDIDEPGIVADFIEHRQGALRFRE